jgi:periplasmic protein TonB
MPSNHSTVPNRGGLLFVVLAAVIAIAGGAFWYAHASRSTATVGHTANDGSDVGILLGLADTAWQQKNFVAPVGSNVYEFYFSVLQSDPANNIAIQRLKDAFKPACDDVENTINSGDLDEAQRELYLLRMYDPHNYRLALLGGVLDAQRIIERHTHEAEALRIQSQQGASGQSNNG